MNASFPLNKMCDVIALSHLLCPHPIKSHLAYATPENFIGRPIQGYTPGLTDIALMTQKAAKSLCEAQNALLQRHNLGLFIRDSYRPKRAVADFAEWATKPVPSDASGTYELQRKTVHYPRIEKNQLFDLGYLANDSQHCYGHTVDLVLIDKQGNELALGAPFDFMDSLSHTTRTEHEIGIEAFQNRALLSETMIEFGFIPYQFEFWHFSHRDKEIFEPIDIVITDALRGLNTER